MSTTTGATDDTEYAGGGLSAETITRIVNLWNYLEKDGAVPYGALIRAAWLEMVPVGKVIASAADVAKVPTADELAAMRELVSNAPGFDETLDALTVVRAYLERVTG